MSWVVLGQVDPDRDQAHRWAVEELSKHEYQAAQPGLFDRVTQWLWERLTQLHLGGDGTWSPGAALGVGLVVLVLVVAAVLGWRHFGGAGATHRRGAAVFSASTLQTAAEHRRRAEAAEAAEQWAVAVLERFRAVARELEERTLLHPAAGRTADEVAAEGSHALPGLRELFTRAAHGFDDVVYGDRPATGDTARLLRELDQAVRAAPARMTVTAAL